jgi:lipoprotein-releasing system permease protein
MSFPFLIAFRYLISKKTTNVINIISGISVGGVTIGTIALSVILSVFNGLDELIQSLFNQFDPNFKIEAAEGKYFNLEKEKLLYLKKIPDVISVEEIIEENVLLRFGTSDFVARIKGVPPGFSKNRNFAPRIVAGIGQLESPGSPFAIPGIGIASRLNLEINSFQPIHVYAPRRFSNPTINPEDAFNHVLIYPTGIFSVQPEIDSKFILVSLETARNLLEIENDITSIELICNENANEEKLKKSIESILGTGYQIKTRFEQKEFIYKTVKSEKLISYIILTFILIVASFSIMGSLTMLIIDKKPDISILKSLGCTNIQIQHIFLIEGWLISLTGLISGLVLGAAICYGQQQFGWVKLASGGSFIVQSYPVRLEAFDFLIVFATVASIGILAAWYPVRQITKRIFAEEGNLQVK